MDNLYNRIYKAINEGVIKSLHIEDEDNKVTYSHSKTNNYLDPLQYEFVDLGLPSGTLWCNHNLRATCEDNLESWYGGYYAWGETEMKFKYNWRTYKQSDNKGKKFFKYNTKSEKGKVDNLTILLPEDDIVQIEYSKIQNSKIAEKVKMPTKEQLEELIKYTNNKWITNYKGIKGLNGKIFLGSNGNSIFIPAAGFFTETTRSDAGGGGELWSSFRDSSDSAWILSFQPIYSDVHSSYRYFGFTVRGVYTK